MDIASKVDLTPLVISYVDILIFPSSRVSIRIPSIAVIVPLLDTVPIAGVSLFIKVDFETVIFILFPFSSCRRPKHRVSEFILLVGVVVVGGVEIVDYPEKP
jgi:hypothetical protein